ncbi:MAG TPA: DNA mismatch repair protein MutS [Thermoanaerobaculia bacterium]|nr:DNA mismatch repair protein MutS [Thermoanaerobaculia bacterium]
MDSSLPHHNPGWASPEPAVEYGRRLDQRRAEAARWGRLERTVSYSRLAVMIVVLLAAWLSIQSRLFSPWWSALPLVAFLALVVVHRRVLERGSLATRSARYYEAGLARLEDRWSGAGPTGARFLDEHHPYAVDLDLFGTGSLFQLLCTARTPAGEDCLARWLLAPAEVDAVRERQQAIAELEDRLDFREDLWRLAESVSEGVHADRLRAWAAAEVRPPSLALRLGLAAVAALQILGVVAWAFLDWGPTLLLAGLLAHTLAFLALRARIQRAIEGAHGAGRELTVLASLLARVESETFESARLRALRSELDHGPARAGAAAVDRSPAREVARLDRLVDLLESRRNPIFAPIALLLVWVPHLALATEAWRASVGARVARWIDIAGEIEALAALSGYAYEHPEDPFPELVDGDEPILDGAGLGHPTRPATSFVRNDLRLEAANRVLVVSGSNMSGKSTFLRTAGVNVVLALAGAPVRARGMRLSRLRVGASIQVHDSLAEGQSRFYAEILRLRQILGLAKEGQPVLFLLDEILHGTNSHDRRIGAEAVIRSLLRYRTIGLVTTHDLALARIAEDPEVPAENVHFEDDIVDGKMVFDYRLRPGVVRKSNALALMREVGLEV